MEIGGSRRRRRRRGCNDLFRAVPPCHSSSVCLSVCLLLCVCVCGCGCAALCDAMRPAAFLEILYSRTGEHVPEPVLFLSRLVLGCMTSAGRGDAVRPNLASPTEFLGGSARFAHPLTSSIYLSVWLSVLPILSCLPGLTRHAASSPRPGAMQR